MAKRPQEKKSPPGGNPGKVVEVKPIPPGKSQAPASGVARVQSWWRRDGPWGLLLVAAVFLAYQPVWHAGFIWDDDAHLTANPCIVGPLGLKEIWTTSAARICPLVLTTFWVEHALWGLHPLPYHLVNVFVHAAGAIVLWRVLRALQVPGAWLGAALWALHPVQVESVAWITELKNTQSGLFYLLSIFFFVRELNARETGDRRNYALMLLFAALAMASKSSTVMLPVVLCLCAWWVEGRWQWRNLVKVAPLFVMVAAAGAVSIWTQALDAAADPPFVRSGPERLVTAGRVVWFYLGKLIWPHPLIFIYPRWQIHADRWLSYLPLVALLLVLLILWRGRHSWGRPYFFALAYFVAALIPVLGLVDHFFLRYSFVSDHFQYLAGMGPLALAGAGITTALGSLKKANRFLKPALSGALLFALGLLTWRQCAVYGNVETLWETTLAGNPECWMAHNNLGSALQQRGRISEAMDQYERALQINPDDAEAHNNLGNVLQQTGHPAEAMEQFEQAVKIKPDFADAHNDLGTALLQKGRVDEGIAEYQRALEINPIYAVVRYNLGNAFFQKGQVNEAIAQYQTALEINPNDAETHNNLGNAFFQKGRMTEAIAQYQMALAINPNYGEAYNNLGRAFLQNGQADEAIVQYQMALAINPDYAGIHDNLGAALFQKGRIDEAIAQYQTALAIDPNYVPAHDNLGIAWFGLGRLSEAAKQFHTALQINPADAEARNQLAKLQALQKTAPAKN